MRERELPSRQLVSYDPNAPNINRLVTSLTVGDLLCDSEGRVVEKNGEESDRWAGEDR